tara:strand:+ start:107 stop:601 length:495 start_codon:yes stop_codon:yes gene_type:complete
MDLLDVSLICSTLSCTLVTGFVLTYALIVMPGLSKLEDKEFMKAFQVTDREIQNNQPIFMLIWLGSIVSIFTTIFISIVSLGLHESWLMILVGTFYLLGVQGITISIHLPLNERIQKMKINEMNSEKLSAERLNFEKNWNFFNIIRTIIAFLVCVILLLILTMR